MISLGATTKVHLLAGATDMRRGFDGLSALARGLLEAHPLRGHVFCLSWTRIGVKLSYGIHGLGW